MTSMNTHTKYSKSYFMPPISCIKWAQKESIETAPIWCSVDLRDGNQSLIIPMSLQEKLDFFKLLCEVGFKEIEIGFPAASETDFEFTRTLIDQNLIPDGVAIQVLTQAREHIIRKTFAALKGCNKAIVHLYNSTSVAQREQVFKKSKEEILEMAVEGAKLLKTLADETEGNFRFEYSPESFTGTEPEYALQVCNAVLDVWQPTQEKKVIINLPSTVEVSLPHVYASQIEYMCENIKYRKNVVISLHPHNDRGCGVADCELGLLAGADRIEGTLFGNGERTGNADIITIALNMYSHGVDPELNFSNMPKIVETYETVTRMQVPARSPYSGELVFAAFSGSHQDAIAKGMKFRDMANPESWSVPYLPIDPSDVGREYQTDVIRINSQSGKGGIGYLLEQNYGYNLPAKMREDFGYIVKSVSDHAHKELSTEDIHDIFKETYVNRKDKIIITDYHFVRIDTDFKVVLTIETGGQIQDITGIGNGRLDAVSHAISKAGFQHNFINYAEHSLTSGSASKAVAYVCITNDTDKILWGAGVNEDIIFASIKGLLSAINRS